MTPWVEKIPELSAIDARWKRDLVERSHILSAPINTTLFAPGKAAESMVFLLSGSVRVQQVSDGGREIVLYRIEAGQSCIMTTACLMGHEEYSAEGISETDVEIASIPKSLFDELIAHAPAFRDFVFATFSKRMTDLLFMINDVAFGKIDIRLAKRLLTLVKDAEELKVTHQQLAIELGTAREVISRQLQEFQRRGWIAQTRGALVINNRAALSKLASTA